MRIEFSENSLLIWPSALGCLYSGRFFVHYGVSTYISPGFQGPGAPGAPQFLLPGRSAPDNR